jgi:hypothetical protein
MWEIYIYIDIAWSERFMKYVVTPLANLMAPLHFLAGELVARGQHASGSFCYRPSWQSFLSIPSLFQASVLFIPKFRILTPYFSRSPPYLNSSKSWPLLRRPTNYLSKWFKFQLTRESNFHDSCLQRSTHYNLTSIYKFFWEHWG